MSFIEKTLEVGRRAANILELDLDACENSYGISPCTATLALTNLLNWSQEFDEVTAGPTEGWQIGPIFLTADAALAPDGTMTADRIMRDIGTAQEVRLHQNIDDVQSSVPLNSDQSISFFVKPFDTSAGNRFVELNFASSGAESAFAVFDIIDGFLVAGGDYTLTNFRSANIEPAINVDPRFTTPGWYRVTLNFNSGTFPGTPEISLRLQDGLYSTNNGASIGPIGSGCFAWAAQRRPGDQPGKYQVTVGAIVDGMGTVDNLCFNTFGTCQDTPNYIKEVRTYRFIDRLDRPADIADAAPAITNISYGPTRLEPGGGLAFRGKITVSLQDFTTNDVTLDDYTRERTYNPLDRSTFFAKLKARHKFYIGRPMRVLEGYMDEPFDIANFRTREFIIEQIVGPDRTGKVQIIGKDPLSLAKNARAKAPTPSVGTLIGNITAGAVSLTVSAGDGPDYDVDIHLRIDDEIMLIGVRAGDVLPVTRGQGGTTAAAHTSGAAVQSCLTYDDEPIIDVIQNLLEDFANIDPAFIPFADWQTEEAASLSGYDLTTIISEPNGVQKLLKEIVEVSLLDIWYSDVDQEIKLKLQTPFTSVTEMLNDDENILADSLRIKDDNNRRLTRVLIYYGVKNFARDLTETENYSLANFEIEADKEGANKFNDEKIKVIFSRWMDASNIVQIQLTSQRLLLRFGNMPIELSFDVDAKDVPVLETGDVYDVVTRAIVGAAGLPVATRFQVIETKPLKPSSIYRYTSLAFFVDPTLDSLTIVANETNFDLFVELGGPAGPVDVTVTINAGVFLRATNGNPAFKTDGLHPDSTLILINNGHIHGHGGRGGGGGSAESLYEDEGFGCVFFAFANNGVAGQAGGDAMNITISDVEIDNTNGDIFGGGGGGGGGNGRTAATVPRAFGGGGGGGGLGEDTASGGSGGTGEIDPGSFGACGTEEEGDGIAGTAGTDVAEGTGGASGGSGAGIGGDGGNDWGEFGDAASIGPGGGPGGFAVRLNGALITFTGGDNPAQVKGNVA